MSYLYGQLPMHTATGEVGSRVLWHAWCDACRYILTREGDTMDVYMSIRWRILLGLLMLHALCNGAQRGWAQDRSAEIEALRKQVEELTAQSRNGEFDVLKRQIEELRRKEAERQQQIEDLQRKIEELQAQPGVKQPAEPSLSPLERAVQELAPAPPPQPQ